MPRLCNPPGGEGAPNGVVLPEPGDSVVCVEPRADREGAEGSALVQKDSRGHLHGDAWGDAPAVVASEAFRRSRAKGRERGNGRKLAERNGSGGVRSDPREEK